MGYRNRSFFWLFIYLLLFIVRYESVEKSLLLYQVFCISINTLLLLLGIWLHESGVLGASPDGFVQGDFLKSPIVHHQQKNQPPTLPAIIEVKCSFTAKDLTIAEACSSIKDFYLGMVNSERYDKQIYIFVLTCKSHYLHVK